jgi:hypothetical protein
MRREIFGIGSGQVIPLAHEGDNLLNERKLGKEDRNWHYKRGCNRSN